MLLITKLVILVIVLITIFIIYNLLKTRNAIKMQAQIELENHKKSLEGFGEEEIQKMKTRDTPIAIQPIQDKYLDLPIREFIVKSSYNSAISGDYASKDAIRAVLERGFRLLDFEIYTKDGGSIEYVSYSKDDQYIMDTKNTNDENLSLADALTTVIGYSFTKPSPSQNDPLFIFLRITNNLPETYTRVANLIDHNLKSNQFVGKVDGSTPLRVLMGKIVIIFDGIETSLPSDCILANYINIYAGTTEMYKYDYSSIMSLQTKIVTPKPNSNATDIDTFTIVTPTIFETIEPPNPTDVINNWHPQFLLYKFYMDNTNLVKYENIFNDAKSSFVPVSTLLAKQNLKNKKQNTKEDDDDEVIIPARPQKTGLRLW
jgi:hypothetical protein